MIQGLNTQLTFSDSIPNLLKPKIVITINIVTNPVFFAGFHMMDQP